MKRQDTTERIIRLHEALIERANHINNHPGEDLCMDLDLIMEDLRALYREYSLLKRDCIGNPQVHEEPGMQGALSDEKHMESAETPVRAEPSEPISPEPRVPEPPAPEPQAPEPTASREIPFPPTPPAPSVAPEPPVAQTPPAPEDSQAGTGQEQPEDPAGSPAPPEVPETPAPAAEEPAGRDVPVEPAGNDHPSQPQVALGEKLSADDNSVHRRIAGLKEDRSIGARMQQHPISNIKEAIGVNEKFLFINELFNGNIQAYNEAIASLNNM